MTSVTLHKHAVYVVGAWAALMVLTVASWWLAVVHSDAGLGLNISMISILVLTFGKIAVVGHFFMELREAAPWLQRTFFGWCLGTCVVLSVMHLTV